jgi:hypothetical protein
VTERPVGNKAHCLAREPEAAILKHDPAPEAGGRAWFVESDHPGRMTSRLRLDREDDAGAIVDPFMLSADPVGSGLFGVLARDCRERADVRIAARRFQGLGVRKRPWAEPESGAADPWN